MKISDKDQLKKMDAEKLKQELNTVERELAKTRFEVRTGQSKSNHLIGKYKTQIARIKTLLPNSANNNQ